MNIKSSQDLVEEANKSIQTLDPTTVKSMLDKNECVLIDVRDIRELWKEGTVKNAKHIPRGMLEFWLDPQRSYFKENKFDLVITNIIRGREGSYSDIAKKFGIKTFSIPHGTIAPFYNKYDTLYKNYISEAVFNDRLDYYSVQSKIFDNYLLRKYNQIR